MTKREMYLKMAEWLREHRFSDKYIEGKCGCFLRALHEVYPDHLIAPRILLDVIGGTDWSAFYPDNLRRHGWVKGCTDDAVAACLIAADLAA